MEDEFKPDDLTRNLFSGKASTIFRKRLKYLVKLELSELKPALHSEEIIEIFRKFCEKFEIDIENLKEKIDSADVFGVTAMLEVLLEVQNDLKIKDLLLGRVFYDYDKKSFKYFNFKSYAGLQK
jgi:hypothetical protein